MTVCWESLEAPKFIGGLGFGNLQLKNLGLLSKWWWKFANTANPLWKRMVKSVDGLAFGERFILLVDKPRGFTTYLDNCQIFK